MTDIEIAEFFTNHCRRFVYLRKEQVVDFRRGLAAGSELEEELAGAAA